MRKYMQFSKKCVVATLVSVNVLTLIALIGMIVMQDFSAVGELMKYYIAFAGVVFVSYCGNSAIEKCAVRWAERGKTYSDENG